ncbi:MAG: type II CAAX endopeptidase family protein [Pseudomonadota bacterium]
MDLARPFRARAPSRHFAAYIAPARARPGLWRLVLGIVLIVAVYLGLTMAVFVVWTLGLGSEASQALVERVASAAAPGPTLLLFATFVPLVLGVALITRFLHKRRAGTLFGPRHKVLKDFVIAGAAVTLVHGLGLFLWGTAFEVTPNLPLGLWIAILPLTLIAIAVQTLAEELLFRGYMLQQLAVRCPRPLVWMVLPSILFGVLHFDPARLGEVAVPTVTFAILFGLMAADLTARTGGLGAAWGAHFANNVLAIAVLATSGTVTGLARFVTPYGVDDLTFEPLLLAVELLPILFLWWLLRRVLVR